MSCTDYFAFALFYYICSGLSIIIALYVSLCEPLTCVYMCPHVFTCVFVSAVRPIVYLYSYTCTCGVSYMYRLSAHSMVSHHCVLPIFPLLQPFC